MQWFRLYNEIIDDTKINELSDREFRQWIYLLCLASEREQEGVIDLPIEKVCWRLRVTQEEIENTVNKLRELSILSNNGNNYEFINWRKRQFRSDTSKHRTREYRKRIKSVTSQTRHGDRHGDGPETETETETETEFLSVKENCPQKKILDLYHSLLPEFAIMRIWNPTHKTWLRQRWKEDPGRQKLEWWENIFNYIRRCPWLMGDNPNGWTPDLAWIVKQGHFADIVNGKYEDRGNG